MSSPGVYYTQLAFMEGHLLSGRDLYAEGYPAQGAPHLSHPLVEHYPALAQALEAHRQGDLEEALRTLSDQAGQSDDWQRLAPDYQRAREAIDAAQASVDAAKRDDPRFISDVALALLKQAAVEYDEAVENGEFVNRAEYQDGRGFVLVARELWRDRADTLEAKDAEAYRQALDELETLIRTWPATQPPETPVMSPAELYAAVSRFELATSDFRH